MTLEEVRTLSESLSEEMRKAVIGQDSAIELLMVALLTGGHVLLEGVPGVGKTLLVRSFASALSLQYGRIQFTPDLMPGDVLGTNLFNFQTNQFSLTKGPIFTETLLADEINRTPPKTQAALLQAMQERAVTIDGTTHDLGTGFIVIATQNPIEQQGTYPLPEAQLDRFLFKHILQYPSQDEERTIVRTYGKSAVMAQSETQPIRKVADLARIMECRNAIADVELVDDIIDYIVEIVRKSREHPSLQYGASPRAANMFAAASRAYAAMLGRDFVIPDDIKFLAAPILRHRVILAPGAEIEGLTADRVVTQMLDGIEAPR